ncbi:GatB/YqeY domain-containing protein [Dyella koreensis]|uniref:GatB/YqeY domain-containing protein n=1 Tax=Dyella koreensis TaxID=311235 RepID=A0ABW8K7V6_9GAMM
MHPFPTEQIKAIEARYSPKGGPLGLASIAIELAPFEFNGETHNTSLRCDQIDLGLDDFSALAGKSFQFPFNPAPGYVDGSMCLFGVHVFFLTRCLSFGRLGEESIPLKVEGVLEFSSSGLPRYEDTALLLETTLYLPLTAAQRVAMVAHAIKHVDAQSPRDIGKVMAVLAKEHRADGQLAALSAEAIRILQTS